MQTLEKFINQDEARIAMSYLRANGINAELADADTSATLPHVGMGATMLRLQVPAEEVEEARALLDSVEDGSAAFNGDQFEDDDDFGEPEETAEGGGVFIPYRTVFIVAIAVLLFYFLFF